MGYTQDEIKASVERLMLANVRYAVDVVTANRKITTTFNDVQEAAAATFVMFPAALMHVAELSSKVLLGSITTYRAQVEELVREVASLNRVVDRVAVVTPLANTTAALIELEGVVGGGKYRGLQAIPSYQRFNTNASRFLTAVKPAVVSNGDVVPSKSQAMAAMPGQVAGLREPFDELHTRVANFANAVDDYASMNLPVLLAQNVVRRARQMLQARQTSMTDLSVDKQQDVLRDATLEMLTAKGVLASMESFEPPPVETAATGSVWAFADATHAGYRTFVQAAAGGPYPFFTGVNDQLHLEFNDDPDATFDITIPAVAYAYAEGWVPGPYSFHTGTPASVDGSVPGPYVVAAPVQLRVLFESSAPNYQKWEMVVDIPIGAYSPVQMTLLLESAMWAVLPPNLFSVTAQSYGMQFFAVAVGPAYRITVLDGDANGLFGFVQSTTSAGQYRNDQLTVTFSSGTVVPVSFVVQFAPGMQTVDQVVATFNAAIPAALVGHLHAETQQYAAPTGNIQQYLRVVVDEQSPDVSLRVTGTTVPGQPPNSGTGVEAEATPLKMTADRLVRFLNAYEQAAPPRKFSDYAVAEVQTLAHPPYTDHLRIVDKLTTGPSKIFMSGTAVPVLIPGVIDYTVVGSSRWLKMSSPNTGIAIGDTVVAWKSGNDQEARVLARTDEGLLYTEESIQFGDVYPFAASGALYAVVRRGDRRSFDMVVGDPAFQQFLLDDHALFFSDLNRYTNMMLSDNNPTEAEINTLLGELNSHLAELDGMSALLTSFQAYACKPMDDMFRMLVEKGSDKAVDVLLECRFSDFFGLDIDTSSYAGTITSGLQTVAQQDLPVVKFDRVKGSRTIVSTSQDVDYEIDFSDSTPDTNKYKIDKT